MNKLQEIFFDRKVGGELIKNIGLGIFVNALYGASDGIIEFFNVIDLTIGVIAMVIGIILERSDRC
jgi:predicted lipid-binding transport protein (Tim44 family)